MQQEEEVIRKVTIGQRLKEEEKGSHGDEQNSVPGRGNSKCKDPGVTLFLACWERVELKRSQGGESSRR